MLFRESQGRTILGRWTRRVEEVRAQIERYGTYAHIAAELTFGARAAWRNSSRCIGRLYRRSLRVRDRRHVTDAAQVAAEASAHLREATNGGGAADHHRVRPRDAGAAGTSDLERAADPLRRLPPRRRDGRRGPPQRRLHRHRARARLAGRAPRSTWCPRERSLWRDRALVELNLAVRYYDTADLRPTYVHHR